MCPAIQWRGGRNGGKHSDRIITCWPHSNNVDFPAIACAGRCRCVVPADGTRTKRQATLVVAARSPDMFHSMVVHKMDRMNYENANSRTRTRIRDLMQGFRWCTCSKLPMMTSRPLSVPLSTSNRFNISTGTMASFRERSRYARNGVSPTMPLKGR